MTEVVSYQEYQGKILRFETRIQILEDKVRELEEKLK